MNEVIPNRNDLLEDAADWIHLEVSFPRLSPDTADSCPRPLEEIMNHVRMESADTGESEEENLRFLRTARVGDLKYWLWQFTESDGEECYVLLRRKPAGGTVLGLTSKNGLSPDQYFLADYYDEVYWS